MQKSIKGSLPGMKTTILTVVAFLVLGVILAGGLHAKALLGLVFAAVVLAMIAWRNYDFDSFEEYHSPTAHSYRIERDRLFNSLRDLTEAVEADSSIAPPDVVAVRADQARQILNEITARPSSR